MPEESLWPKIFVTGVIPEDYSKVRLLYDITIAETLIKLGYQTPPLIDKIMTEIDKRVGVRNKPYSFGDE